MNTPQPYLNEVHRQRSEKASAALAKQSPMSYEECIEQAKKLSSRRQEIDKPVSTSNEQYVPSRNANSAA